MTEPTRLSKRLMHLLGCSRREADLYIEGGWVTVSGEVVEQPQFKVVDQEVCLLPEANLTAAGPVTLLLHALPDQAVAAPEANARWEKDEMPIKVLHKHFVKLQPCLALPAGVGGLQVLSQNGGLIHKMTEIASKLEQELVVEVQGSLTAEQLASLNQVSHHQGKALPRCRVSWQSDNRLRFAVKNPQPKQIATMCEAVGLQVMSLKRIRIGAIPLAKMPPGQWRYLATDAHF